MNVGTDIIGFAAAASLGMILLPAGGLRGGDQADVSGADADDDCRAGG